MAEASDKAAKIYKTVDVAVDAYGVYEDAKDAITNISEWTKGKFYTPQEYDSRYEEFDNIKGLRIGKEGLEYKAPVPDSEKLITIVSDRSGIPLSGWNDPKKFDGNVYKTAGTLWSYAEKLLSDPVTGGSNSDAYVEVALGKFKDIKFLKDVLDVVRDTKELIISETKVMPGVTGDAMA